MQGKAATLKQQLELLPLVVWSEAEHDLVRGGDAVRRRFLDRTRLLLEPAAVTEAVAQARALRQKRSLLAQGGTALAPWNELLAPQFARTARARADLCRDLAAAANELLVERRSDLGAIELDYHPSPPEALAGEAAVLAALAALEQSERRRGQPLAGPSRDRITIALGERGTRRFASGGEQKLVALALVAALARLLERRGRAAVALLDDLESELDPARAELAASLFSGLPQVVATSSAQSSPEPPGGVRWRLDASKINPAKSTS